MVKEIHLIGIGGVSMSGIASVLLDRGYRVTGSDLKTSKYMQNLAANGAKIQLEHQANNLHNPDIVVISSAIPKDNPELVEAQKRGIPIYKRAEILAKLMQNQKTIAIAGTHGKTTTTSMLAVMADNAGLDPSIMVGGLVPELGGNIQNGSGKYFITEADESDGSFLYFDPSYAVLTNLEFDHPDFYEDENKLREIFYEFIEKVPDAGKIFINHDDPFLAEIVNEDDPRLLTFGIEGGVFQAKNINYQTTKTSFDLYAGMDRLGQINLLVPGQHNVYNALAAVSVALSMEISFETIKNTLSNFKGAGRRFEKKGLLRNEDILIIDDYAHHPTEIKTTLKAARQSKYQRIIAIFQPHRYSRTESLYNDFVAAFASADLVIITDIYGAGESPRQIDMEQFTCDIQQNSRVEAVYISDFSDIKLYLDEHLKQGDLVLTLGAGDVYQVGEMLLKSDTDQKKVGG